MELSSFKRLGLTEVTSVSLPLGCAVWGYTHHCHTPSQHLLMICIKVSVTINCLVYLNPPLNSCSLPMDCLVQLGIQFCRYMQSFVYFTCHSIKLALYMYVDHISPPGSYHRLKLGILLSLASLSSSGSQKSV